MGYIISLAGLGVRALSCGITVWHHVSNTKATLQGLPTDSSPPPEHSTLLPGTLT